MEESEEVLIFVEIEEVFMEEIVEVFVEVVFEEV